MLTDENLLWIILRFCDKNVWQADSAHSVPICNMSPVLRCVFGTARGSKPPFELLRYICQGWIKQWTVQDMYILEQFYIALFCAFIKFHLWNCHNWKYHLSNSPLWNCQTLKCPPELNSFLKFPALILMHAFPIRQRLNVCLTLPWLN